MKLILGFFLIFVMSTLAIDYNRKTVGEWYREVEGKIAEQREKLPWDHSLKPFTRGYSANNIKLNMKFNENENKKLNFAEAMILIYGSIEKHFSEEKRNNAWNANINSLIEFYKSSINENDIDCFKMELKKIDPNSPQVEDFNINSDNSLCEATVDMNGLDIHINEVEKAYGPLTTLTGGKIDRNKFKKILLTFVVLSGEIPQKRLDGISLMIVDLKYYLNAAINSVLNQLDTRQAVILAKPTVSYSFGNYGSYGYNHGYYKNSYGR